MIDATETPIERPKKAKALLLWEEEKAYAEEPGCRRQEESANHLYSICEVTINPSLGGWIATFFLTVFQKRGGQSLEQETRCLLLELTHLPGSKS